MEHKEICKALLTRSANPTITGDRQCKTLPHVTLAKPPCQC